MISFEDLDALYLNTDNFASLVDIENVVINPSLPPKERLENYLSQIKNPYHFKCGNIAISINYAKTDKTLKDIIKKYFIDTKL